MAFRIHNSYTGKVEVFEPLTEGEVRLYNCGPTVYNFNHIGNFRAYVCVDLLRRYLKLQGFKTKHASNITDVDDKIIANSIKNKMSIQEFTAPYVAAFLEDLKTLSIEDVEYRPKATESIPMMLSMIETLQKQGHTYVVDGSVYFRLSTFEDYGRLSKIDPEHLKTAAGGRFTADEYTKEDARDFALWKKPDSPEEQSWPSPFGDGRPGWHLECSAMIRDIFGPEGVDIHLGGIDLLFPHHENEIAQSQCAYPNENFAKYWVHNEHLLVEGKKMSKSAGNYFTLRDLVDREKAVILEKEGRIPPFILELIEKQKIARAIRYLLISTHYRMKLNFTFDALKAGDAACDRLQHLVDRLLPLDTSLDPNNIVESLNQKLIAFLQDGKPGSAAHLLANLQEPVGPALHEIVESLDDDLNLQKGLGRLFELLREIHTALDESKFSSTQVSDALLGLFAINRLLGILEFESPASEDWIDEAIRKRIEAKKNKDFKLSDQIRDDLLGKGIRLKDTPQGTVWEKV